MKVEKIIQAFFKTFPVSIEIEVTLAYRSVLVVHLPSCTQVQRRHLSRYPEFPIVLTSLIISFKEVLIPTTVALKNP